MDCAQDQLEPCAQAQLETEIVVVRHSIARLKARLVHSFEEPSSFSAASDELRQATERLRLIEAELKTRKLETREEVWWCSSKPSLGGATKLSRSAPRFRERRARR